jgi:DNA repair exonuclease SbcCD ATPase subunit
MNYLSLFLRIVAILAAITAGILYFLLEGRLEEKEKELVQVRNELRTLKDENESANLEIAELREKLTGESQLIEETKVQFEEAQAKLITEMQESQRVQKKFIETQKKVAGLEETTNRLREELVNAENLFAAASQEGLIAQLNERIESLTLTNKQLRDQIRTLESPIEDASLPEIEPVVSESDEFAVRLLTPDEVQAIKEEAKIVSMSIANGIIILNVGKDADIKPGMIIDLVKNSEVTARIEIININGSLAIAYIRPEAKLDNLSKGDTVKILR